MSHSNLHAQNPTRLNGEETRQLSRDLVAIEASDEDVLLAFAQVVERWTSLRDHS